jgi:hypothetical protein
MRSTDDPGAPTQMPGRSDEKTVGCSLMISTTTTNIACIRLFRLRSRIRPIGVELVGCTTNKRGCRIARM